MRVVCQRVTQASVTVADEVTGKIGQGLLLFVGIAPEDTRATVEAMAAKIAGLRIFADDKDRMNLSLGDIGGGALVVSQFTLFADCKKGRRPFFGNAAAPELASALCDEFSGALRRHELTVAEGVFGADMAVALVNDGPVTIVLDSKPWFPFGKR